MIKDSKQKKEKYIKKTADLEQGRGKEKNQFESLTP